MIGWGVLLDALIVAACVALTFVLMTLAMHWLAVWFLSVAEWF